MRLYLTICAALVAAPAVWAAAHIADTDGDGMFSAEELKAAFPDLTDETFAQIDTNGDGLVDADELTAAEDAGLIPTG